MIRLQTSQGPFYCYDQGTITRALAEGQWWDDHLKPILDTASPGLALDIGAHIGWFTRYLCLTHPVIACEPWPDSFALLRLNTDWCHGLQVWPVAAYDRATSLQFAPDNDTTDAGSFGFLPVENPADETGVVGIALDQYIQPTEQVSLIKCDAQGADLRALQGLRSTIRRCRPLIVFEWEEGMAAWQGDTWEDYERFFEELNYSVERITPDYWDFCARPR